MAADREQAPRKLVYLRDRAARPKARPVRQDKKPRPLAATDLHAEGIWLGRTLFLVAAGTAIYWLMVLSGAIHAGVGALAWRSTVTMLFAQAVVVGTNGLAALRLLRDSTRQVAHVALAAGAAIAVAVEGLARLVIGGDLSDLTLSTRVDILANTAALGVGIWALSYALRAQRRDAAA
jgi:hypothetical protein